MIRWLLARFDLAARGFLKKPVYIYFRIWHLNHGNLESSNPITIMLALQSHLNHKMDSIYTLSKCFMDRKSKLRCVHIWYQSWILHQNDAPRSVREDLDGYVSWIATEIMKQNRSQIFIKTLTAKSVTIFV
eukprot:932925_1